MIRIYNFDTIRPNEILNRDIRAEKNVEDIVEYWPDIFLSEDVLLV